jgi:hypothetical protein
MQMRRAAAKMSLRDAGAAPDDLASVSAELRVHHELIRAL